jgi:DNA-binding NarL/FixJ family response regulator
MTKICIAIVEDEEMLLTSLTGLFGKVKDMTVVATAPSVEGFLMQAFRKAPDVMLLDIRLPDGMTGLEGIKPIKKRYPNMEIIMLTTFEEPQKIFTALCAGATAYATKRTPFPKIVEAIRTVHRGGSFMSPSVAKKVVEYFAPRKRRDQVLTPRQHQIVQGIVEGLSYKMIADKLLISQETVKDHIKTIYRKLEINSKGELIQRKLSGDLDSD